MKLSDRLRFDAAFYAWATDNITGSNAQYRNQLRSYTTMLHGKKWEAEWAKRLNAPHS